eukprot:scaffold410_cov125-Isochrysis_galbana.AAC.3
MFAYGHLVEMPRAQSCKCNYYIKKILRRKRYLLAATWLDTSVLLPSGHSPSPPPFFPHPFFLIQAAVSGGWGWRRSAACTTTAWARVLRV